MIPVSQNYHEEVHKQNLRRLREVMKVLPAFLDAFFRGIADTKASSTRLVYAMDLKLFFTYLTEELQEFSGLTLQTFTLEHFKMVTADHIERFMAYIDDYTTTVKGREMSYQNTALGKTPKLAAVRTMFAYYYKKQYIQANPAALVDFPKVHQKAIIHLEVDEIARLLDEVESGEKLTGRQPNYHQLTKKRDLALMTLLLGTGMRISECVGVNLDHLDFNKNAVKVTRKGGDESVLYFSQEVADALESYVAQRQEMLPVPGHEDALFLSIQRKRLGVKSIQVMVKKYARLVTTMKKITPHKLRSTFGTALYNETNDIYLVAEVLGHADINTTKKHYAHMSEERRRRAAGAVKLRQD